MKEFNTITEIEILRLAYRALEDKIDTERRISHDRARCDKRGKADLTQAFKYEKQADEILGRLVELEFTK